MKRKNPITKKAATFLLCAALSAAALLILSCTQLLEPPDQASSVPAPSGETGRVVLAVASGAAGGARTILPTAVPVFSRYKLVFSKSGESDIVIDPAAGVAGSGESRELAAGTWTAAVTAYRKFTVSGGSEAEYPAAGGSESITVSEGQITNVTVHLTPLPVNGAELGIFTYKVTLPAGAAAEFTLGGEAPVPLTSGTEVSIAIASGYYDLFISAAKGALSAGLAEKVHIYAGLESKGEFTFTDADFTATVGLAGSVNLPGSSLTWADMSSGTVNAYSDPARTAQIGTVSLMGLTWAASIPVSYTGSTVYLGAELTGTDGKVYTGTGDTGGSVTKTGVTGISLSDTTAPASVTGLSGVSGPGEGEITLSWTNPADADLDKIAITWNPADGSQPVYVDQGTATQTKTISGLTAGTAYTFTVKALDTAGLETGGVIASALPFVPVTGITTGLPAVWQKTILLSLSGTVAPANATNQTITWSVKTDVGTGAYFTSGNTLTTTDKGTVTVTATIANGTAVGTDYTQDFTITITPKAGEQWHRPVTVNGTTVDIYFRYVPAGRFQRDDTAENISVITKGYWIAETEVTQELFALVMAANPSYFDDTTGKEVTNGEDQNKRPVDSVSWYDAIAFCNKLSLMDTDIDSPMPIYELPQNNPDWGNLTYGNIPQIDNSDWNNAGRIPNMTGYRLPTEMEWLWAAMGADTEDPGQRNTTGYAKYFAGDDAGHTKAISSYVWYADNSDTKTHQVGNKAANELGLRDMTGNVAEWCWDWQPNGSFTPPQGKVTDYQGFASDTDYRSIKGHDWHSFGSDFTSHMLRAYQTGRMPHARAVDGNSMGFRLVFSESGE